ncbi:protein STRICTOSIDINE SYNTHASE-LIKE 10-like [Hibiscus syriacus]|uniref:protein STRICTOSIDINE SYNTHASE-LIKE 10-like n=1 Tax=Hibiscus syriacus TaxID=106335 RepID=UPI001921A803|nr:protein STRICTOSIDINE SYNTHASE-LIKE 10-like [Hibiscus syriacus]
MKMYIFSVKFLAIVFFLLENVIRSYQQLPIPANYHQMDLHKASGPESIAFDCKNEGPYVGVSDGRILKWQGLNLGWKEFAVTSPNRDKKVCDGATNIDLEPTCGRPLGLKFNRKTCDLYIADAYFGLLAVGPNGGKARQLVASAEGIPFKLTNALDIDTDTGMIYFTDSSNTFQRRHIFLSVMSFDRTGRLLKYDPRTKQVTVMYKGLAFPNGVALSKDNSFLLVAESMKMRILKFNLGNEGNGYVFEQFVQLSRTPDNVKRNEKGEFWVGLNSGREGIQDDLFGFDMDPVGIKYDEDGKVLKQVDGNGGLTFSSVSEIEEFNGELYIGSVLKPYVGILSA